MEIIIRRDNTRNVFVRFSEGAVHVVYHAINIASRRLSLDLDTSVCTNYTWLGFLHFDRPTTTTYAPKDVEHILSEHCELR